MRLGYFFALLTATTIFLSGPANACSYYEAGTCGVSSSHQTLFPRAIYGVGLFREVDASARSAEVSHDDAISRRRGWGADLQSSNFGHGGEGGNGVSAGQSASLFDGGPFSARGRGADGPLLALNVPGLNLGDGHHDLIKVGDSPTSAVDPRATPLPASWTMMLSALALFGAYALYRRLRSSAAAPLATAQYW
jgi:PEP-CTERM motif-containing protein